MYKLLLVSDQEDVLDAFAQVQNWELIGFKPPHIRHDFEGAKDSLIKHHADGVAIAVSSEEEEEKILTLLQQQYPYVSIFQAGHTTEEVLTYLKELKKLLNRVHADFSNDQFRETDMIQVCRHDFFRKVIKGNVHSKEELFRNMRLLRSRMDANRPCMLVELEQSAPDDQLEGRWHDGQEQLERTLRTSFGGDLEGIHILPTVHEDGRIQVLFCPLQGVEISMNEDSMTARLTNFTVEGVQHLKEFFGLELHIKAIQVLPALNTLCDQ